MWPLQARQSTEVLELVVSACSLLVDAVVWVVSPCKTHTWELQHFRYMSARQCQRGVVLCSMLYGWQDVALGHSTGLLAALHRMTRR